MSLFVSGLAPALLQSPHIFCFAKGEFLLFSFWNVLTQLILISLGSRARASALTVFTALPIFPPQNTPVDELVAVPPLFFSGGPSWREHQVGFLQRFAFPKTPREWLFGSCCGVTLTECLCFASSLHRTPEPGIVPAPPEVLQQTGPSQLLAPTPDKAHTWS